MKPFKINFGQWYSIGVYEICQVLVEKVHVVFTESVLLTATSEVYVLLLKSAKKWNICRGIYMMSLKKLVFLQ